ncbi:nucleoside diphosphate kinase 6 [Grus japonensis]|uniref:Nucleoside diphosphate kinase 6 n=1 Tax=Grus japonensis TaxID=30415 RepID=A0ABC9VXD9_GRUJA
MTRQGVFSQLESLDDPAIVLTTRQSSLSHSVAGGVSRLSKAIFETKVLTVRFLTEKNNSADTKVSAEGGGGGAPGAGAEIPLQPLEKTMVRQAVPLKPMEVNSGADIHLQPVEDPMPEQLGFNMFSVFFSASGITSRLSLKSFKHLPGNKQQSDKFQSFLAEKHTVSRPEEKTRRGAILDLVLTNNEKLVENVKLKGSLGCSDHEMMEFKILRAARRAHSKLTALDFRRADFGLFRDVLGTLGQSPGGKKGSRQLANIQGPPPPSSGAIDPNKGEVRQTCLEACMDEQGAPGQTQTQKGSVESVEAWEEYRETV